jgi:hypothetical protein
MSDETTNREEMPAQTGDAAKLREALEGLVEITCGLCCNEKNCELSDEEPCDEVLKAHAALSAPPRNCDVGDVAEQDRRFRFFCTGRACEECEVNGGIRCAIAWGQLPYEAPAEGETRRDAASQDGQIMGAMIVITVKDEPAGTRIDRTAYRINETEGEENVVKVVESLLDKACTGLFTVPNKKAGEE